MTEVASFLPLRRLLSIHFPPEVSLMWVQQQLLVLATNTAGTHCAVRVGNGQQKAVGFGRVSQVDKFKGLQICKHTDK